MIAFTIAMALLATALLLVPGTYLAWLLARRQWRGKTIVETLVTLPLVMPPVATGLILLGCAATAGLLGISFGNFAVNLILLGLGWNFAFIGATTVDRF